MNAKDFTLYIDTEKYTGQSVNLINPIVDTLEIVSIVNKIAYSDTLIISVLQYPTANSNKQIPLTRQKDQIKAFKC